MKIQDLYEARKKPDQNTKEGFYDFLLRHADDPDLFLHTTDLHKVGINPHTAKQHRHDTPAGISTFHLQTIKESIKNAKEHNMSPAWALPYFGGQNAFILRSSEPYTDTLKTYSESDLERDITKLKTFINPELVDQSKSIAHTNENFVNSPIGILWGTTKAIAIGGTSELSHQQYPNAMTWNKILRKLGFTALHDKGYGWLHGAESSQSLFLSSESYTVEDHMMTNRKQPTTTIDQKEYRGGRLPKVLHINKLNSTEIANLDSNEETQKVREVIIKSTGDIFHVNSLKYKFRNAKITIKTLIMKDTNNLKYITDNIHVERLMFNEFPSLPSEIERLEQVHHNVDHVLYTEESITQFRQIRPPSEEKFSPELFAKIKPYQ